MLILLGRFTILFAQTYVISQTCVLSENEYGLQHKSSSLQVTIQAKIVHSSGSSGAIWRLYFVKLGRGYWPFTHGIDTHFDRLTCPINCHFLYLTMICYDLTEPFVIVPIDNKKPYNRNKYHASRTCKSNS